MLSQKPAFPPLNEFSRTYVHRQISAVMATGHTFSIHDVGVILEGIETDKSHSLLKTSVLFHSNLLSQASSEQNHRMREDFCIKTVLDTDPATGLKSTAYDYVVSHVLGVTHCRVQVRGETFTRDLLEEQPSWKLT